MDPNKTLANIRALAAEIRRNTTTGQICELADELAWTITDLDQWLTKGGFPPTDWNHNTNNIRT